MGLPVGARREHLELDCRELAYGFAQCGLLRRRQIPIGVSQLLRPPCEGNAADDHQGEQHAQ